MSTVLPNGTIRFLANVPIDEDYQNSLDFLSKNEQTSYFLNLTAVHTMTGATRVRDGVIKVNVNADTLLTCNYLMFQNLDFFNKWFYAFITDIEYLNNNACNVYYAIDDIQTWLFDVTLEECFVEREHTTTDGMFEHLIDEGISVSEYVDCGIFSKVYDRYVACLYTQTYFSPMPDHPEEEIVSYSQARIHAGTLDASRLLVFDLQDNNGNWLVPQYEPNTDDAWGGNDLDRLGASIYKITKNNQADSIVGLAVFPASFFTNKEIGTNAKTDNLRFDNFASNTQLDNNYVPKNKKLYNSPYCILKFCSTDGQEESLQPEYVDNNCEINIIANVSPNPSLIAFPLMYGNKTTDYEHAISIENFPQASVAIDGFKAWTASGGLSKQIVSTLGNVAGGTLNTIGSMSSGNPVGTIAGALSVGTSIADAIINIDVAKRLPAIKKGNCNSHPLACDKRIGYYIRRMCINSDTMKSIDNYFSMYGYKVNKVKTPSRRNRPHYTYLKTKGCKVIGGAPADAINRIQTIYDNGIRFWVNASEVGQYSTLDNSPV